MKGFSPTSVGPGIRWVRGAVRIAHGTVGVTVERKRIVDRILVVEDESAIAAALGKGLAAGGFAATTASCGAEALDAVANGGVDLVILDLGLPDMDGLVVLDRLRQVRPDLPVVVLTARDSVQDTIAGLGRGADDYMSKPFRIEELLARVRLRLRDSHRPARVDPTLSVGALSLDLTTRAATVAGRTVELSAREFALLEYFLRHRGVVLSRGQILSGVWGYDFDPGSNLVDVYVGMVRRKVGVEHIVTVRGAGYRCG